MKRQEMEKINKVYRESLKPNWDEIERKETHQGQELERPVYLKQYQSDIVVELDMNVASIEKHSLMESIQLRKSIRQYKDRAMSFKELSYLVINTCFIHKIGKNWAMGVIPTPGATRSLETYLYIDNVEGLKKGLYHYNGKDNKLYLINDNVDVNLVNTALREQFRGAQVVFFWSTTPERTEYKYSFTAHKMISMEAGHACQNLYLGCTCLDLGMVAIGAYSQADADKLLNIDGENEFAIYMATVGNYI